LSNLDWLGPEYQRRPSPNKYWSGYKPDMIQPIEAVIYHYTASVGTAGTISWLCDSTSKASAHFVIARDGTRYQLVPLTERAWHAGGVSSFMFNNQNVNGRTIGIEIMNVGPLVQKNGVIYSVAENKEFNGPGASGGGPPKYQYTMWEAYADEQIKAVIELTKILVREFPILAQDPVTRLIGHEDVDPTRKQDPGPLMPWDLIRSAAVSI